MGVGAAHRQNGDRGAGGGEDGEGHEPARAVVLAESDRVGRQPGHVVREENGGDEYEHRVQRRQSQAGQEGAFVHVADRAPELVGHDDQHQGGRDDLRQGAGGGDHARSHPPVVAVAQHDRQRDQPHRDHRRGDHAGRRRQQRPDEDHRIGKPAADGAEQLADGVEQVLGHAGSLEHQSHEGEERDREQRIVAHHAIDALGQRLQEVGSEQVEPDPDQPEDQAVGGEREGDRVAEQQEEHERREHDRRHVLDEQRRHGVVLGSDGPRINASRP